ncbi:hypothetical protein G9A89_012674 [Geosiphon pyriformis]|nr:hypothetical protein G9A89_012674 [Geosiphon pyriformis]
MIKKTKSSEKWGQLLVSAIFTPNPFVVPNEILDKIFIILSGTLSKMGLNQPLAVLPNMVSSGRSLPVLDGKQSLPVGSSVLENWANQMETESSPSLVASILVLGATFKIKLAHIKTVFQFVHGFLGAKSVSKDNMKLFCVEFASQISLDVAFLVELTSSVRLVTFKIAKSLVVSEFESPSAAVVLHDVPLGVSAADIKTALSVFGMVTCVVLKSASIWQYVVVHFEKLDSAMSALNHWSVLVGRDSVKILPLVNQNETILSCDKFKAKLVNLPLGCTVFEISNMIFQVGGQSCFIPQSLDSGCCLCFALVTFGSQADLDLAVAKTSTLKKCHIWWKTLNCQCLATKTPNLTVLEFCHAIYTQNQSDLGLPEGCCPAESALTYYINARINYHIGKEEEPHDAKLGLECTNKTKENLKTNQESNQQKLGTPAQTPKKTVTQSIKKQRIYSPEDKLYHFSSENKIQISLGAASSSTSTPQTPRTPSYIDKIKQCNWGDIPITGGYSSLFQNPLFQPKFRMGFENHEEESESESEKETSKKTITKPVTGTSSQSRNQKTRDQEEEPDIREATFRNAQGNIISPPLRPINPPAENGNKITTPYIARLTDFLGEEEETDIEAIEQGYYTDPQVLNQFIRGLKSSILGRVRSAHPNSLPEAVTLTRALESAEKEANHSQMVNMIIEENKTETLEKRVMRLGEELSKK